MFNTPNPPAKRSNENPYHKHNPHQNQTEATYASSTPSSSANPTDFFGINNATLTHLLSSSPPTQNQHQDLDYSPSPDESTNNTALQQRTTQQQQSQANAKTAQFNNLLQSPIATLNSPMPSKNMNTPSFYSPNQNPTPTTTPTQIDTVIKARREELNRLKFIRMEKDKSYGGVEALLARAKASLGTGGGSATKSSPGAGDDAGRFRNKRQIVRGEGFNPSTPGLIDDITVKYANNNGDTHSSQLGTEISNSSGRRKSTQSYDSPHTTHSQSHSHIKSNISHVVQNSIRSPSVIRLVKQLQGEQLEHADALRRIKVLEEMVMDSGGSGKKYARNSSNGNGNGNSYNYSYDEGEEVVDVISPSKDKWEELERDREHEAVRRENERERELEDELSQSQSMSKEREKLESNKRREWLSSTNDKDEKKRREQQQTFEKQATQLKKLQAQLQIQTERNQDNDSLNLKLKNEAEASRKLQLSGDQGKEKDKDAKAQLRAVFLWLLTNYGRRADLRYGFRQLKDSVNAASEELDSSILLSEYGIAPPPASSFQDSVNNTNISPPNALLTSTYNPPLTTSNLPVTSQRKARYSMSPSNSLSNSNSQLQLNVDQLPIYYKDAANAVYAVFDSDIATYTVREAWSMSPSNSSKSKDEILWKRSSKNNDEYEVTFDPTLTNTVEISARVFADGSSILLSGDGYLVQTQGSSSSKAKVYNYNEVSRCLDVILYIDTDGSEREYPLNEVYNEMLSTRSSYCTSLVAAAAALQAANGGDVGGVGGSTPRKMIKGLIGSSSDNNLDIVEEKVERVEYVEEQEEQEQEQVMYEGESPAHVQDDDGEEQSDEELVRHQQLLQEQQNEDAQDRELSLLRYQQQQLLDHSLNSNSNVVEEEESLNDYSNLVDNSHSFSRDEMNGSYIDNSDDATPFIDEADYEVTSSSMDTTRVSPPPPVSIPSSSPIPSSASTPTPTIVIPTDDLPPKEAIISGLNLLITNFTSCKLNGSEKKQLSEINRSLTLLIAKLSKDKIEPDTIERTYSLVQAIIVKDFTLASNIQASLCNSVWKDHKDWLKGLKFLIQLVIRYSDSLGGAGAGNDEVVQQQQQQQRMQQQQSSPQGNYQSAQSPAAAATPAQTIEDETISPTAAAASFNSDAISPTQQPFQTPTVITASPDPTPKTTPKTSRANSPVPSSVPDSIWHAPSPTATLLDRRSSSINMESDASNIYSNINLVTTWLEPVVFSPLVIDGVKSNGGVVNVVKSDGIILSFIKMITKLIFNFLYALGLSGVIITSLAVFYADHGSVGVSARVLIATIVEVFSVVDGAVDVYRVTF